MPREKKEIKIREEIECVLKYQVGILFHSERTLKLLITIEGASNEMLGGVDKQNKAKSSAKQLSSDVI